MFSQIRFQDDVAGRVAAVWAKARGGVARAAEGRVKQSATRRLMREGYTRAQAGPIVDDAADTAYLKLYAEGRWS